jgi:4'-phosphopantetheinyl transferase EntD
VQRPPDPPPPPPALGVRLGPTWLITVAAVPVAVGSLTAGERVAYDRLPRAGGRRSDWLTGRAALKALLRRLGEDDDTSRISLPHPRIALSHAGRAAVAFAARQPTAYGVGVDVEPVRRTPPDMARFFLGDAERAALDGLDGAAAEAETLRLWTVKEAVFKADMANSGAQLRDYVLDSADRWVGWARRPGQPQLCIRYRTVRTTAHLVTVAQRRDHRDDTD